LPHVVGAEDREGLLVFVERQPSGIGHLEADDALFRPALEESTHDGNDFGS
jgi:hypothetical protein